MLRYLIAVLAVISLIKGQVEIENASTTAQMEIASDEPTSMAFEATPEPSVTTTELSPTESTSTEATTEESPSEGERTTPEIDVSSSPTTSFIANSVNTTGALQSIFKKIETLAVDAVRVKVEKTEENVLTNVTDQDLSKMSNQIRAAIRYYQEHKKVVIPGNDVPDPMPVPNFSKKMGGSPFTFTNMTLRGLSNFTVDHINTNLDKMQVYIAVYIKRLVLVGNYSMKSWFSRAAGPFNITLHHVQASGAAELTRDDKGNLIAKDSEMDMIFLDATVDFKNMGMVGSLLQGVMATAAPVIFDGIKPSILKEINNKTRDDVNAKIKLVGTKFAASGTTPPLEYAIKEIKIYIINNGYDPYRIKNYVVSQSIITVNISHFILTGLSDFHKVGDIELSMDEGNVQFGIHVATLNLKGRCQWNVKIGKNFEREGWTNFTADHMQVKLYVNQSIDVREHPYLHDLDINMGKVRMDMKGTGKFDIVFESIVNTLPDLIRHIIVDAIEEPLKVKVQDVLDRINVGALVEKGLPELDNMGL